MSRTLVEIQQVADHFGVTVKTVRVWLREGNVPAYRVGPHLLRFDLDEVEAAVLTPVQSEHPAAEARQSRTSPPTASTSSSRRTRVATQQRASSK